MNMRMVCIGAVAIALLAGRLASGQDISPAHQPKNKMHAMEIRQEQLDPEQRRADMQFNNQMRNIHLEKQRQELDLDRQAVEAQKQTVVPGKDGYRRHHDKMKHFCGFMLVCLVVNILLAIWIYQDIRRRNTGSGVWIVLALLTGLLGTLVYAVVRLGDKPAAA
jgi:hypothetical protein